MNCGRLARAGMMEVVSISALQTPTGGHNREAGRFAPAEGRPSGVRGNGAHGEAFKWKIAVICPRSGFVRQSPWRVVLAGLLVCVSTGDALLAAESARYEACFVDGRRVEGNAVSAWHDNNTQPKLDATDLLNPAQPLRWLKDRRPVVAARPEFGSGFVELIGGDQLPGTVIGLDTGEATFQIGSLVEPQLLVRPDVSLAAPNEPVYEHVRVLARLRRVV